MEKNHYYIIADHIRAACFIISDGVKPSGKQQGYVLRRLIRRSLASSLKLKIDISNKDYFKELVEAVAEIYEDAYTEINENKEFITELLTAEAEKYLKALDRGNKEWSKILNNLSSGKIKPEDQTTFLTENIWDLYQTHGVPIEVSEDYLDTNDLDYDKNFLEKLIENHQKMSQEARSQQFKSGLAEQNEKTVRLHTVTHVLHSVLRELFGQDTKQMGSAITTEKARFDFSIDRRLEQEEIKTIEKKVQEIIDKGLHMERAEMSKIEAESLGAIGLFGEKYGETVSVYTLYDQDGKIYSREFCGGPHVKNSSEIGNFKILKQKSVGQGVKRLEYDVA
jgi:alanyl-tRNA synthetase